jgi:hypothetical protein
MEVIDAAGVRREAASGSLGSLSPDGNLILTSEPPEGGTRPRSLFEPPPPWHIRVTSAHDARDTRIVAQGIYAHWSPDGRHITYFDDDDLVIATTDGTEKHRIEGASGHSAPSWSADGARFVFGIWEERSDLMAIGIYVLDVDSGAPPRRLTSGWLYSLSPDGETVVFSR